MNQTGPKRRVIFYIWNRLAGHYIFLLKQDGSERNRNYIVERNKRDDEFSSRSLSNKQNKSLFK